MKGDKDGISVRVDIDKFINFDEVISEIISALSVGKGFYKNSVIKVITNLKNVSDNEIAKLKDRLFEEIHIRDCIFDDTNKRKIEQSTIFTGTNEGRTKFIERPIRGGQCISSKGNIVVIGDVNNGAEVSAGGNVIVLGSVRGRVRAGVGGNRKAIIAAFMLQPELLQIADLITISPDDEIKPSYPEVARVKDGMIIVEPYLPNKYIY
ncbi:MAG: septum site-determining protein MinC [Clostridium sp.]|nr:septum site-determining protein MinC [Clostridium sp.]